MSKEKDPGMKSSYQIAIEKLEEKEGKRAKLSEAQLDQIAEIDSKAKAKIAELEILMNQRIAEAASSGDVGAAEQLKAELVIEIKKINENCEKEKANVHSE